MTGQNGDTTIKCECYSLNWSIHYFPTSELTQNLMKLFSIQGHLLFKAM